MDREEKLVTVFTPTYNRDKNLSKLYESLLVQTSNNFKWLIVDDGSTDGTSEYVGQLQQISSIDIRYVYQENHGKHAAHNRGVLLCDTELFFCVDSDDALVPDAVAIIEEVWNNLSDRNVLGGLVAYRCHENGEIVGNEFPPNIENAPLQKLYALGKRGDTALVFRTEVLRRFPFPVFEGEKFLRESIVYNEIDREYKLHVLRQKIYVCEYLPEGLTKQARRHELQSPRGAALYRYHEYLKAKDHRARIGYAVAYLQFSMIAGEGKKAIKKIGIWKSVLLMPIVLLAAVRFYYLAGKSN